MAAAFVVPARVLAADVPSLWPQAKTALASAQGQCVVDVGALERFDSSALALLLSLRREAQARGVSLVWQGASGRLTDLAALYGIDGLLSTHPTADHRA